MIKVYALSLKGDTDNDTRLCVYGVYLHGLLETQNGFDLVSLDPIPEEDGIYDCMVCLSTREQTQAKLFFWKTPDSLKRDRGLIVLPTDTEYLEDAKIKFDKREVWL